MIAPMKMLYANPGTPMSTMPLRIKRKMNTPSTVPMMVPRPPVRAVPPNHDHGDDLQLVACAAVGIGRGRANGADDASETRHDG